MAILYPTSLANLVVEVGTRHCHQTLLKSWQRHLCADTMESWHVQCTHGVVHYSKQFEHAVFDRYVYVVNFIKYIQAVNTKQIMSKTTFTDSVGIMQTVVLPMIKPNDEMKFLIQCRSTWQAGSLGSCSDRLGKQTRSRNHENQIRLLYKPWSGRLWNRILLSCGMGII